MIKSKMGSTKGIITTVLAGVLGTFAAVAVLPDLFQEVNSTSTLAGSGAPAWVLTLLPVIIAFGAVFIIYSDIVSL